MSTSAGNRPEFFSSQSYSRFAQKVRRSSRYILDQEEQTFLRTVVATIQQRDEELKQGQCLYRAQVGVDWVDNEDDDGNWIGEDVWGYGSKRMKPLADRAREGRANPVGIPVLYAGTTVETAISEVRPWVDAEVSLATCRVLRPLRVLNLSLGYGKASSTGLDIRHALGGPPPTPEEKERAVWVDIDNAFSQPVTTSDDQAEYAPTQILAEVFRNQGYDAIAYKSHFGDSDRQKGYNIAIFDLDAVEVARCAPYRVQSIKIEATQFGNPWFKKGG